MTHNNTIRNQNVYQQHNIVKTYQLQIVNHIEDDVQLEKQVKCNKQNILQKRVQQTFSLQGKYQRLQQILKILVNRRKCYTMQIIKQFYTFPDDSYSSLKSIYKYGIMTFEDDRWHTFVKIYQTKQIQNKIWGLQNLKFWKLYHTLKKFVRKIQTAHTFINRRTKQLAFSSMYQYSIQNEVSKEDKSLTKRTNAASQVNYPVSTKNFRFNENITECEYCSQQKSIIYQKFGRNQQYLENYRHQCKMHQCLHYRHAHYHCCCDHNHKHCSYRLQKQQNCVCQDIHYHNNIHHCQRQYNLAQRIAYMKQLQELLTFKKKKRQMQFNISKDL